MSKVYNSSNFRRTCLIRGLESEGRFFLIRKGLVVSRVVREIRNVDTNLVYDERVSPRPVRVSRKSQGGESIRVMVGMMIVRKLLGEVHKMVGAVERGVEEHAAAINYPHLMVRAQAALGRVNTKVIKWSQDLLNGKVPHLSKKPKHGTGPLAYVAFHDSVYETLIVDLRKLTAVELKGVLPSEMFQSVLYRAIEELDEPGR